MFKKSFLLFFCVTAAGINLYAASSSENPAQYLKLNPKLFPGFSDFKIERYEASAFSPEDLALLKTGFLKSNVSYDYFKKDLIDKECFFYRAIVRTQEKGEESLGISVLKTIPLVREETVLREILFMAVSNKAQRQGVGKTLIKHIEIDTKSDVLSLMPLDEKAIVFYKAVGFKEATPEEYTRYACGCYIKVLTKK